MLYSLVLLGFGLASAQKHFTEGFNPGNPLGHLTMMPNGMPMPNPMACGSTTMPDAMLSDCDADDATGNRDIAGFYRRDLHEHEADSTPDTILRIEQCGDRMIMSRKTMPTYARWRIVDFVVGSPPFPMGGQGGFDVGAGCRPEVTMWTWTADDKLKVNPIINGMMGSAMGIDISWEKTTDGLTRTQVVPSMMGPSGTETFTKLDCDVNGSFDDCDTRRRLMKAQL